ncbi:Uncharacterised protein [Mycobacterium tuberculosis]|nr:Uncharacterised protein [Mycobacterium tuberculosis]
MVTEPPPIDTRSLPKAAIATRQPSFTPPTTSRSGTNTSSKKTSLNSVSPVISVSGRICTAGSVRSMIIAVMPLCLRTFGSVRTVASPRWQFTASLVHTF